MPTYHYVCDKCGHEFELFQSMTADALRTCPKAQCGRKTWGRGRVKRLLSGGAGLIFKGQGFYTTDYRSSNYQEAAKKESEAAKPKSEGAAKSEKGSADSAKPAKPAKAAAD